MKWCGLSQRLTTVGQVLKSGANVFDGKGKTTLTESDKEAMVTGTDFTDWNVYGLVSQ